MPQLFKFILFFLLLFLLVVGIRSFFLLRNSRQLFKKSDTFPSDFQIGNVDDPPLLYVVLGDSTAHGVGVDTLEETLPYLIGQTLSQNHHLVQVKNFSHTGAKLQDVLNDQLPHLSALKPAVISLHVGANDATHFTTLTEYRTNFQTLIKTLQTFPSARIYITSTPDLSLVPALFFPVNKLMNSWAIQQNTILKEVVRNPSVQIINLYDEGKLDGRQFYAADLFHPSKAGYARWAALFK